MENQLQTILRKSDFTKSDIVALLSLSRPDDMEALKRRAFEVLLENCGTDVYFRGLVEFSNLCVNDCNYCGIRKSNLSVNRYCLSKEEILECAGFCADAGYGSIVLQSGERRDERFIAFVEEAVREIKSATVSPLLPRGLGITLSVGEQDAETFGRFYTAGAHRYLLRIETSSPVLYAKLHPAAQTFESRIACLRALKTKGFQVGTGVMIGFPGQTVADCADDILFFRDMDVDMIGMGPYIVHGQTPMAAHADEIRKKKREIFDLSLRMIAVARIVCRNVNIASTTALQAMEPFGRELGLEFGANIIMPQVTPERVRRDYLLYEGKLCLDEDAEKCRACLESRIKSIGRDPGSNAWGDSRHFTNRT